MPCAVEDRAVAMPRNPAHQAPRHFLNSIRTIAQDFRIVSLTRQIRACEAVLREDQPIDVAIVKPFKADKSS